MHHNTPTIISKKAQDNRKKCNNIQDHELTPSQRQVFKQHFLLSHWEERFLQNLVGLIMIAMEPGLIMIVMVPGIHLVSL